MKKRILPMILMLTLTMGLSVPAFAADTDKDTKAETKETSETAEEKEEGSKSAHLLAAGYELMEGLTIPVGTTNKDLDAENLEPKNAEKISIDGAQGKEKLNLYVFRPAKYKKGEKTPVIYYIHGGGYQFGSTGMSEGTVQDVADGANATVVSVDYTLTSDPGNKYPMELEDAYAGLLYVYEHADELNVDKDNIVIEGESAGGGLTARLALYNRDKGKVPLKGLPETFMIVGSLDLFCAEDMDYANKLMQAGVFTELHVEPGVPHAYESFSWTPQAERFSALRNNATNRMLGNSEESKVSEEDMNYEGFFKYIFGE